MKCPKCSFEQTAQNVECVNCGIIFEKYRKFQDSKPDSNSLLTEYEEKAASIESLTKGLLFYVKPETNPVILVGRALFFLVVFMLYGD